MIDLYTYINEGLLQGMDRTLAGGEKTATRVLIADWLKEQHSSCFVTLESGIDDCINDDNTLELYPFSPWYAYAGREMKFPVPDYIDIKHCNNISMTMRENVNFADLPHVGTVDELLLKPFSANLKFDLSKLRIDNIKAFEWVYNNNDIIKFPKKTNIDTFIMWSYAEPSSNYGSKLVMIGFDKLKGLVCNKLAIPDVIFAEKYSDFNTGYNSMIRKGSFEFDSQVGQMLSKLFNDNSIQFKKLYVYSACANNYKFYELKKDKNGFTVAKRGTNLIG